MARVKGDTNYTAREKRLAASNKVLSAMLKAAKEALKVKNMRLAEMRKKLGGA